MKIKKLTKKQNKKNWNNGLKIKTPNLTNETKMRKGQILT